MVKVTLTCQRHPQYTATKKPLGCERCWLIYDVVNRPETLAEPAILVEREED